MNKKLDKGKAIKKEYANFTKIFNRFFYQMDFFVETIFQEGRYN